MWMSGLSAARLLAIWERGTGQLPVMRALELLAAAFPDDSPNSLAGLAIGQRDIRLFKLREQMFGNQISSLADCPACGETVEMTFQASDLTGEPVVQPLAEQEHVCNLEEYRLSFRLPDSRDVLAAAREPDPRRSLAERCILEAIHAGQAVSSTGLPEDVLSALGKQIAEADPLADIWFSLSCPGCGHTWQASFDVVSYFWNEIETWAYHTLQEVHCLARAYGWNEAEILGLSAWRRQFYISQL